jgi:hypothetical protein
MRECLRPKYPQVGQSGLTPVLPTAYRRCTLQRSSCCTRVPSRPQCLSSPKPCVNEHSAHTPCSVLFSRSATPLEKSGAVGSARCHAPCTPCRVSISPINSGPRSVCGFTCALTYSRRAMEFRILVCAASFCFRSGPETACCSPSVTGGHTGTPPVWTPALDPSGPCAAAAACWS